MLTPELSCREKHEWGGDEDEKWQRLEKNYVRLSEGEIMSSKRQAAEDGKEEPTWTETQNNRQLQRPNPNLLYTIIVTVSRVLLLPILPLIFADRWLYCNRLNFPFQQSGQSSKGPCFDLIHLYFSIINFTFYSVRSV